MALSGDTKQRVLYHLCYPATTLTVGNVNFNSVVRDRLDINDSSIEDLVDQLVKELDEAEDCIQKAVKCLKVESVENIRMNKDHVRNSRQEYNRLIKKLSCTLDIPSMNSRGGVSVRI